LKRYSDHWLEFNKYVCQLIVRPDVLFFFLEKREQNIREMAFRAVLFDINTSSEQVST
jgi:hypothetical protein